MIYIADVLLTTIYMILYLYKKLLINLIAVMFLLLALFILNPNLTMNSTFSIVFNSKIGMSALFWGTIFSSTITYFELKLRNEIPVFDNFQIDLKKHLVLFAFIGLTIKLAASALT